MPVQRVCRPDSDFRGFQGQVESGEATIGDIISVRPSGEKARIIQLFLVTGKQKKL